MTDLDIRLPDRQPYELGDRYRSGSGAVVLTGVQAIARAFVEQHERDARAGLRVAPFVSGYQGSPRGGGDRMTGSSASGTARAPDWTGPRTRCGTPTCTG